jgi:hypothetical protein
MKRFSIQLVFFLAVFSCHCYSQHGDSLGVKRFILTTSVLEYFPSIFLNTGNFNIGTEIYLGNSKSVYFGAGLIKSYGPTGDNLIEISALSTTGVKLQLEGRRYLNKRKLFEPAIILFWPHIFQYHTQAVQNSGYYTGFHCFYQYTETVRLQSYLASEISTPYGVIRDYKDNLYTVSRNATSVNLIFGYQCIKRYGLVVDYFVGAGVQFISSHSWNRVDAESQDSGDENELFKPFNYGNAFAPSLIYKVRVGWGG